MPGLPDLKTRQEIRFRFRGREIALSDFSPRMTLLDWLRIDQRATGTKEGCNEGDCGACTLVLVRRRADGLHHAPVNACILLLGQVDGAEVVTVEDLAQDGVLHPVQQAMVEHHASQCGFCTPGIVMSLFAQHESAPHRPSAEDVQDQLAGNLCRCTGYRPIVDAALAAHAEPRQNRFAGMDEAPGDVFVGDAKRFFAAPESLAGLAALYEAHPQSFLVSGATDVGLWITKGLQELDRILWTGRVRELAEMVESEEALFIGAGVTHERLMPALAQLHPDLGEIMRRFGSKQVRASGTIGGNIANGSPIGDLAPCLIALGARIVLQKGDSLREIALEDFFLSYRVQDRRPGEFLRTVIVPKLAAGQVFRAYKVSKRIDEDISTVLAAFRFDMAHGRIGVARMGFGGMAGTPARAYGAEGFAAGIKLDDEASWTAALDALALDFQPMSDQRASAAYRSLVARNLLKKALIELRGAPLSATRLVSPRGLAHG